MSRRKAKRFLKKACIFVAVGMVILSPFLILLSLGPQLGNKNTQVSQTRVKESSQFKMATKHSPPQNEFIANSAEDNEAIETPADDNFFPTQKSQYELCTSLREENLQFHEIVHGSVIYSAFLDYRFKEQAFIRMISILPSYGEPAQMYCHFMDLRTEEYFTTVVEIEELGTNEGFPFQGFLSSCDLPEEIDSYTLCSVNVSVEPEAHRQTDKNTKEIPLHVSEYQPVNTETYGLCVPPISGEISAARLVEFIELSQILGVSYFVFYNSKLTDKTLEILRYYKEKGILSENAWDIPHHIGSNVQDGGQTAALNDCLYRNIGRFEYMAFNNLDEFIVPLQNKKTLQIFESETDTAGYCFQSFTFDTSISVAKNSDNPLYTQRYNARTKAPTNQLARCIASPKYVFSLELNTISNPSETFYTTRHVEPSFGQVFRYGECNYAEKDCNDSLQDLTMKKYREELEMRFNLTMSYLRHYGLA